MGNAVYVRGRRAVRQLCAETVDAGGRVVNPGAPFAVQPGEGTALQTPTGDVITIKAATSQTN